MAKAAEKKDNKEGWSGAKGANGANGALGVDEPDLTVSVRQVFGLDTDMEVPAFSVRTEYVPDFDDAYCFDHETTLAILVAFKHNQIGRAHV